MQKVIVICGPTASGKTALSVELAKKINGEIVSCDSMQIYDEMQIGTARVTNDEMQGIKHYMVGMVKPTKRYSVSEYKKEAEKPLLLISIYYLPSIRDIRLILYPSSYGYNPKARISSSE